MSDRMAELLRLRAFIDAEIDRLTVQRSAAAIGELIASAGDLYGITSLELYGDRRDRNASNARQAAMWLLRQYGLSLHQIGDILGRDHTTVLYGCRRIDARPEVRALLRPLLEESAA